MNETALVQDGSTFRSVFGYIGIEVDRYPDINHDFLMPLVRARLLHVKAGGGGWTKLSIRNQIGLATIRAPNWCCRDLADSSE